MSSDRPTPHHVHHPTRIAPIPSPDGARPFALVLAGGGARGLAHAGVLIGLARLGLHPSALVGVSMGAIVATTYALDPHWLADLRGIDTRSLPRPTLASAGDGPDPIRAIIDLARDDEGTAVIAVDPYQDATTRDPRSGLEVMLRAMEICHHQHTTLRLASADLVLRPTFPMPIGTLDFRQADTAVTAGVRIVEDSGAALHDLLVRPTSEPSDASGPPA
jgi:predicted acylesterase/phospholipase RssA